jgi:stage II sporulation protein R
MVLLSMFCLLGAIPAVPGWDVPDKEVVRFHVRAHSNEPHDQEIKNYLAGSLLQIFGPLWNGCQNSRQLHELLEKDKGEIQEIALRVLKEKGIVDPVKVEFAKRIFPARFYGDRFYPPGEYASLTIEIGSGEGENWWCVLFPPLCFTVFPVPGSESSPKEQEKGIMITNKPTSGWERKEKEGALFSEKKTSKWRFWSIDFLARIFCD